MMKIIKKVPIPIAGLMLALAATGNLVANYGSVYRNIFGCLSGIVFLLLTAKICTSWNTVREEFKNPVIATVAPTYSMGLMILATYVKPYLPSLAYGVWLCALILHALLILYVTKVYIFNFAIKNVFPSYFIVFVGIVVGSVTAPAFNSLLVGQVLFWFGLASYLVLLPVVMYRVFKVKSIPEPALPTLIIIAAPASLCLAGYMSTFTAKSMFMAGFLTGLSVLMTLIALWYLPRLLKLKFYPSYSAFTFPLVISAIGLKKNNAFLASANSSVGVLKWLAVVEEWIAVLIVLYVLVRYAQFLLADTFVARKGKAVQG